jgi:hypothetical protein
MTPYECDEAFERLATSLREHRCGWIVSQVEETVNLGRIRAGRAVDYSNESEDAQIREDLVDIDETSAPEGVLPSAKRRSRKGRPVEIQQIHEYTPAERLEILLTAIRRSFVSTAEMESEIATTLQRISPKIQGVLLEDDGGDIPISTDLLNRGERNRSAERLNSALLRLRKMAE